MPRQMHQVSYGHVTRIWDRNGAWRHFESDDVDTRDPARYETVTRVAGVVPELQRRSIYRKDYSSRTFRDDLRDHGAG